MVTASLDTLATDTDSQSLWPTQGAINHLQQEKGKEKRVCMVSTEAGGSGEVVMVVVGDLHPLLSSRRSLTLASNTLNSLLPLARQNNLQRSRGDTPEYLGTHCRGFPSRSV